MLKRPDTLTDAQTEAVARRIYDRIPAGIKTDTDGVPDVTVEVTKEDGYTQEITWDWATSLTVNVITTVALDTGYTIGHVEAGAQAQVETYFSTLGVGSAVRVLDLLASISAAEGINGATVTLNGGAVDIVPTITQFAELGTNTVTV